MSTLSQFAGGGVKSVQRGTAVAGNIAISPVNTAKSVVIATVSNGSVQYKDGLNANAYYGGSARVELANTQFITITYASTIGTFVTSPIVAWQVIEYY